MSDTPSHYLQAVIHAELALDDLRPVLQRLTHYKSDYGSIAVETLKCANELQGYLKQLEEEL